MDYPWSVIYKITIYKSKDEKDDSSLRISTIKTDEGFETAFYEQEEERLKVEVPGLAEAVGAHKAMCELLESIMNLDTPLDYTKSQLFGDWSRKYDSGLRR